MPKDPLHTSRWTSAGISSGPPSVSGTAASLVSSAYPAPLSTSRMPRHRTAMCVRRRCTQQPSSAASSPPSAYTSASSSPPHGGLCIRADRQRGLGRG